MHSYSIDTAIRRHAYVSMAIIALLIPAFFEKVRTVFGLPGNYGFPITFSALYGVMHIIFDRYLWHKWPALIGVPDLNGRWTAHGVSSYKDPVTGNSFRFSMEIIIRQTFTHLEVFTETNESTSRSTMASICTQHAVPIFRYAFDNVPKSMADQEMQRHPGMMELRINDDSHLAGDYFSGKHRLRYGEMTLERNHNAHQ